MSRTRATAILLVPLIVIGAALVLVAGPASGAAMCDIDGDGTSDGILIAGVCTYGGDDFKPGKQQIPPTRTINCGKHVPGGNWNPRCGTAIRECFEVRPGQGNVQLPAMATITYRNGRWGDPQVWCPGRQQPALTEAAIRQQALRLLPRVQIGTAWTNTALVNAETIMWADTAAARDLGTVTIVGKRVGIRLAFAHANWNFGDGQRDQPTNPGKPYDRHDPCIVNQCRDYYGHTYTRTGPVTIDLTVTWTAQFRIDAGDWTDLDEPLTGAAVTSPLILRQARAVLVPTPGD